ncbi:hypothetical protein IWW38_005255, partial [Coemansia aciculifera]
LTDAEFCYVLDELQYYLSLHTSYSSIRLSAADGVWFSDSLIDVQTTNALKDYVAVLANDPSRQQDWHPNDNSCVLNLIDPSLFPLIYSRSMLCLQTTTSPQAALSPAVPGEFPGSAKKWSEILSKSGYYVPTIRYCSNSCESRWFSWLPSEFRVDDNGAVTIESYINNLHLVKHAAFYPIIASVFSRFVPLLEQVVTDLVHPRQPRVVPSRDKYYTSDEPMPENDIEEWKEAATFVPPQPEPFITPERPINPYNLRGRRLQAIVKLSNVELTDKRPIYGGQDWDLSGTANECIIATGIFFYDVTNIAESSIEFRESFSPWDFEADHLDEDTISRVYGIDKEDMENGEPLSQEIGGVDIKDGRCLVFPGVFQHKMPGFELVDKSKPGHCKMLAFYVVDPSTRIPSTEIVPPQQQDWLLEELLGFEPFRSLPRLIVDGIMDRVSFPILLKEAKKIRLEKENQYKHILLDASQHIFEPCYDNTC